MEEPNDSVLNRQKQWESLDIQITESIKRLQTAEANENGQSDFVTRLMRLRNIVDALRSRAELRVLLPIQHHAVLSLFAESNGKTTFGKSFTISPLIKEFYALSLEANQFGQVVTLKKLGEYTKHEIAKAVVTHLHEITA